MAQQECLITQEHKAKRKKQSVKKRKNSEAHRERERNSQQKHFLVQRDKRHLGNCVYVCVRIGVCVGTHATIG